MGLIKPIKTQGAGIKKTKHPKCPDLAFSLRSTDASTRRHAARDMVHCPDVIDTLIEQLRKEGDISVREAILSSLIQLKDPAAIDGLIECMASGDAALRNEVIETFQQLSIDISPTLRLLLANPDPDLRIFAVNILESRRNPDVESLLIEVIETDEHLNVCATAVDLLCEVGTESAVDALQRLKVRFAPEAYIQFAADLALKRIREC